MTYPQPNNPNMQPQPQPMFWSPFYPTNIQNVNRPANIPFMRNNQQIPQFIP